MIYVFVKPTGVASVLIADGEYPDRVAFSFLVLVLDQFLDKFPQEVCVCLCVCVYIYI